MLGQIHSKSVVGLGVEHRNHDNSRFAGNLVLNRGRDDEDAGAGVGCPDVSPAWGLAQRCASSSRLRSAHASLNAVASGCARIHWSCAAQRRRMSSVSRRRIAAIEGGEKWPGEGALHLASRHPIALWPR